MNEPEIRVVFMEDKEITEKIKCSILAHVNKNYVRVWNYSTFKFI